MGKFPVISVSLKGIYAASYETARAMAIRTVNEEASQMQFLLESTQLTSYDKEKFSGLLNSAMDDAVFWIYGCRGAGVVIEVKYSENGKLEEGCQKALKQLEENKYEEALREEGIESILKYGIACYKKRCKVVLEDPQRGAKPEGEE